MKPIVAFAFGGLLIGSVVWFAARKTAVPEPEAPATVSAAAPVSPEAPAPAVAEPTPAKAPAPVRTAAKPKKDVYEPPQIASNGIFDPAPASAPAQPAQPAITAPATPAPAPEPEPVAPPPAPAPPPRVPKTVTLHEGDLVTVRLIDRVSTDVQGPGDSFTATLDQPIIVDGSVIAERGSRVEGRVAEADKAGRVKGVARMTLELTSIHTSDGQRIAIRTSPFEKIADKGTKDDATKVGIGAALGAAIGAIAGGGKGAAIGAGAGGAAGAGTVAATRGKAAELPSETKLSFRLSAPVQITEKLQ